MQIGFFVEVLFDFAWASAGENKTHNSGGKTGRYFFLWALPRHIWKWSGTRETFQPDRSTTSGAGRAGGAGSFWSLSVSAFLSSALPCFVVFFSLVSNDANVKLIVYIYNHKSVGDPVYCRFRFKLLPFSICFLHVSLFIHLLYLFLYETAVCQETEEGLGYFFGAVLCICFTWTTRPMDLAEDRWLPHKLTQ